MLGEIFMSEKITEEKDIKKIIIEYDDGSKEEIEKAFVGIYNEDDISGEVNYTEYKKRKDVNYER